MADYDFRSFSPHDFELLCRDLLQKRLGLTLESFTTGRDSGIDFQIPGERSQRHRAVQALRGHGL
ncbi:MAG: restriction endonuclease [Vicinamibacterales bacterium]